MLGTVESIHEAKSDGVEIPSEIEAMLTGMDTVYTKLMGHENPPTDLLMMLEGYIRASLEGFHQEIGSEMWRLGGLQILTKINAYMLMRRLGPGALRETV